MILTCSSLIFKNILCRLWNSSVVKCLVRLCPFFSIEVSVVFPLMCGSSLHVLDIIPLSVLVITNVFPNLPSVSYLYSWCPLLNRKSDFNVIEFIPFYYYSYLIHAFGVSFQKSFPTSGSHRYSLYHLPWTLCLCHHRKV